MARRGYARGSAKLALVHGRVVSSLWWLSLAILAALTGWQGYYLVNELNSAHASPVALVFVVTGTLTAIALGIGLWARPQYVRLHVLTRRFPGSLVLGIQSSTTMGDQLAEVSGVTARRLGNLLGTYSVLVVDADGLSFWKGAASPKRRFTIHWSSIRNVSTGQAMYARPLPSIAVDAVKPDGEPEQIVFAPNRPGWRALFGMLDPAKAEQLAADIWSRRTASA